MAIKNKKILVVTTSNTIPQRTLLFSKVLEGNNSVLHICWKRHATSNINDSNTALINSKKFMSFATAVFFHILRNNFDSVMFSDFRLFPFIILPCRLKWSKILCDRPEIPTVTAAETVNNLTGINFDMAMSWMEELERLFCKSVNGVLTIPVNGDYMQ